MISQLMTQLNNLMNLEKYQQDKVMIRQLVVFLDFAYFEKKSQINCC